MKGTHGHITRRQFLRRAGGGAGLLAVGPAAIPFVERTAAAAATKSANPFAYDVQRLERTDPKLIGYEQARKFSARISEPRRIAVGPGERLYIAGKSGVSILGTDGTLAGEIGLLEPARCVAVAADGGTYVGLRSHVEVFDRKGQALKSWDAPGPKTWLTGLAVGENGLFAADSGQRAVLRYDRSGRLVGRLAEKNKERNVPGLVVPSPYLDVELGKDGLLRVNNPGRHCVETYTLDGDLELSWGKPSAGIEGFCGCCNPIALALLADGSCVTCEKGLPRVKVYSADGAFQCVVAGPECFPENCRAGAAHDRSDGTMGGLDVAVGRAGEVYVLDLVAADVSVMKKKGPTAT